MSLILALVLSVSGLGGSAPTTCSVDCCACCPDCDPGCDCPLCECCGG